jgi:hypothetical protein
MFGIAGAGLMYAAIVLTIVTAFVSARRAFRTGKWRWRTGHGSIPELQLRYLPVRLRSAIRRASRLSMEFEDPARAHPPMGYWRSRPWLGA